MTPFAAWVAAASERLPWWMHVEPWHLAAAFGALGYFAADAVGLPAPILWAGLAAAVGFLIVSAIRGGRLTGGLIDPVTHLARLEQKRRDAGDLAVPDALQDAADDWGRLDRALSLEMWATSPELRVAADTGMLQIALAREAGTPDTLREAAMSELATLVERAGVREDEVPDDRLWGLAQNAARALAAPHLRRFARRP